MLRKLNFQQYFEERKRLLIQLCILSLLCSSILYTYISIEVLSIAVVNIIKVAIIILVAISTLSVLYKGTYLSILAIFGLLIIIGIFLLPIQEHIESTYEQFDTAANDKKVKHLVWRYNPAYALTPLGRLISFYSAIGVIGLANILLHKPDLLYVKNRPNDLPYPIWDSKHGYTTYKYRDMIPLIQCLREDEKYLINRYRYILVRIGEQLYLVTIDSKVPDSSEIIRKNDQFIGVQ